MKKVKRTLFFAIAIILSLVGSEISAFNYTINFSGSGASNSVENVIVQNLTKGITATVVAGRTLTITDLSNGLEQLNQNYKSIIFNKINNLGQYEMSFYSPNIGLTKISAYLADGRKICDNSTNLQAGYNNFDLKLPMGIFIIHVSGNGYSYTEKLQNAINTTYKPDIRYNQTQKTQTSAAQKVVSNTSETVYMLYNTGDILLYKGVSGNYTTILTDIPSASKTVDFNFIECKDANGTNYAIVKVGTQTWMAENLKATKYRTIDDVTNLTNNSDWGAFTISSWCNYNNDTTNGTTYGKLYNWYSATDIRNIAPAGWHVPSDSEWTTLTTVLNGESVAGIKLKDAGANFWGLSNTATNQSGFTALPGGYRLLSGQFNYSGSNAAWWSATESTSTTGYYRLISGTSPSVVIGNYSKNAGFSIRCLKSTAPVLTTTAASAILSTGASCGGNVTETGGEVVTSYGICWSTAANPTTANSTTAVGAGSGLFTGSMTGLTPNTSYYVRAYATNSIGTTYGNQVTFTTLLTDPITVTDVDGNIYHTVVIGTQTWLVENLKTTRYNDGATISYITYDPNWIITTNGGYGWPNSLLANKDAYGAIYNWYAVGTGKLAPTGWHVATKSDVETLLAYLGGAAGAGGKLKESGTTNWVYGNAGATNTSGFTALPAGYRSSATGNFQKFGYLSVFWTATEAAGTSTAGRLIMDNTSTNADLSNDNKLMGFSVRCVKD